MATTMIRATGLSHVRGDRVSSASTGQLTLTARGRAVVVLLALAVIALVALAATRADADAPQGALAVRTHVVASGETLWAIAEGVAGPGDDVRDVVLELVQLNQLPSAGLMAGQSIVVPVTG